MGTVEEHRRYSPRKLAFATVTASDSRGETEDHSGQKVAALAKDSGHRVVARRVVRDEEEELRAAVVAAVERDEADVVVVCGGTGFSPRDVTVEAILPVLDRIVEGFGELFRALSFQQIGPAAMLSRALAGVAGRSAVFVLPGSPQAVELAMTELILPEVGHLLGQVRRAG
jgi:molybdenum cofactor biosynthesis protein B